MFLNDQIAVDSDQEKGSLWWQKPFFVCSWRPLEELGFSCGSLATFTTYASAMYTYIACVFILARFPWDAHPCSTDKSKKFWEIISGGIAHAFTSPLCSARKFWYFSRSLFSLINIHARTHVGHGRSFRSKNPFLFSKHFGENYFIKTENFLSGTSAGLWVWGSE